MTKPLFLLFLVSSSLVYAQSEQGTVMQSVFLVGNTAEAESAENLGLLHSEMKNSQSPATLIYTGDILHNSGLNSNPTQADSAFIRQLLDVTKDIPKTQLYFIPGDLDWNNSGEDGWKDVKKLESLINGLAGKKIFLPEDGCPGPVSIDLGPSITIALINTPWWIHPYDRPHAPSTECNVLVEQQFIEELEGIIEDTEDKNLLVVGHHPAISVGDYGGRVSAGQHFKPPIVGTFIAGFHQNIGSTKDIAYPDYRTLAFAMKYLMEDYSPFIYASSHDYNLQALEFEGSYQVVSGSIVKNLKAGKSENTVLRSGEKGFIKLSYYDDGKVMLDAYEISNGKIASVKSKELYQSECHHDQSGAPVNTRFIPCKEKIAPAERMNPAFYDSIGTVVGGTQYKAGLFKKAFLGSLYRSSWTATIHPPYLNLDTCRGGLTAIGRGGGRQTHSLSLDGADGKSYVFRSVDKDPIKAIDPVLRKTFVVGLTRQLTATQNPYGAMPVSSMLNATTIFHARPSLYILPDDPKLGMFQQEYGGMLGMLEEKPKKGKGSHPGSYGADDVVRSFDLFRKLYKDHNNRVDAIAFGRARVFDMWIGDWGRHEDNWKWAGFKSGNTTTYFPIPRDRDHAFSRWNGLLPYLASRHYALPNAENFNYRFHDVSSLTWPSRHLDRFLLTPLAKEDWLKLAKELEVTMTDQLIDSSVQQFPKEIIPLSGNTIGEKLKSRRADLTRAVLKYYSLLAKQVNVVGSNKAEYFVIKHLPDHSLEVSMFDKEKKNNEPSGTALYRRIIHPEETKSVNVYGLDGDDVFVIEGNSSSSILLRVLSGKGDDVIRNNTGKEAGMNKTKMYEYETEKTDSLHPGQARLILSDDKKMIEYNRQAFAYNTYLPLPYIFYSFEDGITGGLGMSFTFHSFGEENYTDKFYAGFKVSSEGNFEVKLKNEWHNAIGKWDWIVSADVAQPYPYVYFYDLGNETVKFDSLPKSYYRTRYNGFNFSTGLQKIFWTNSRLILLPFYENNEGQIAADNILASDTTLLGNGKLNFFGGTVTLDIDFRDNAILPKRGVRLFASQSYSQITNLTDKSFTNSDVSLELYQSTRTLIPITLGIKGGFSHAGGDVPFYKLSTVGRTTGLRGYVRDRFTGNTAAYLQNQLSVEFGSVQTFLTPFTIGIFGFFDVGRVWIPDEDSRTWHNGYGGGIYFTPFIETFTTHFSFAFSEEEKQGLFEFGLGLKL